MANGLTGPTQTFGQPLFVSTSTPVTTLGTEARTSDGRRFRYALCGSTATVAGSLYQSAATLTNHDNLGVAAAAIGAVRLTVTLGATAVTANQYAGGLLTIDTTPGLGYSYFITSHPAADASATCVFTIEYPGVIVALTTDSRVTLTPNPYSAVIVTPATTLTGAPVGVAPSYISASQYGWLQTKGPCGLISASTIIAVGALAVSPSGTAGAVTTDGAAASLAPIGSAMVATAAGEINQIMLNLP